MTNNVDAIIRGTFLIFVGAMLLPLLPLIVLFIFLNEIRKGKSLSEMGNELLAVHHDALEQARENYRASTH